MNNLQHNLHKFIGDVNDMPRMRSLLKGWEPQVVIQASDSEEQYSFNVNDSYLSELGTSNDEYPHTIILRARQDILNKVFCGELNPARAHLDGELDVFGSDKDEVKLDAISLILWGI